MNVKTPTDLRRAVGYVRRSTNRQEASLSDQRKAIESYAGRHGYEMLDWFQDDAISGASVNGRDAFKQMQEAARAADRGWRFILVYDVSRFSRGDSDEAGHLRYQFREAGVEVIYCNENLTGTDSDDLVLGVKQWQARQYVKDLSRVTIRGQVSLSESGSWCGGTPPFGFDLEYRDSAGRPYQRVRWLENGDKEIYDPEGKLTRLLPRGESLNTSKRDTAHLIPSTPERVAIVQRIFRECVELGRGYRTIAGGLNRDGISSPRDGNWSANTHSQWGVGTIRSILRNRAYRGDTTWNKRAYGKFHRVQGGTAVERPRVEADRPSDNHECDWVIVAGTHEPLVPPSQFERAQELQKVRGNRCGERGFRVGSGLRSSFLLTGLIRCARCGHAHQGRTVNSTKRRKDGTKIQTRYYCCGATIMKGQAACAKFLVPKEPLEEVVLERIQARLKELLAGEGETLLREYVAEEIAAQGQDPRREAAAVRVQITEIDRRVDVILTALSPETRELLDGKLRDLAAEKRALQRRLEELEAAPYEPIDPEAVVRTGMTALRDLPRLLGSASLEERKELVGAFVDHVTVLPDESMVELQMRTLPALPLLATSNSSVGVVAGAGFEPATFGL